MSEALPPAQRTPLWHKVSEAAANGCLKLPVCPECTTVLYPPREICSNCLYQEPEWKVIDPCGSLIVYSDIGASIENFFKERVPWRIGLIKFDCGPVVCVHLSCLLNEAGQRVRVLNRPDKSGQGVLLAVPETGDPEEYLEQFSELLT